MKKRVLENFSIKNKYLVLIFFVSFSLFVSENVFGYDYFKESYIKAKLVDGRVHIEALTYKYFKNNYAYLANCNFLCNDLSDKSYTLFEIKTPEQENTGTTNLILYNKLANAPIRFHGFTGYKYENKLWPEKDKDVLLAPVRNVNDVAIAKFEWDPSKDHPRIFAIRVTGVWIANDKHESFSYLIKLIKTGPNKVIQSDDQKENTDAKEINPVEVYGESDAVVVKGAENGETIMICNESGVEIKSVVANNNDIRINLPAKQLYFIHIGKSQYKVAL